MKPRFPRAAIALIAMLLTTATIAAAARNEPLKLKLRSRMAGKVGAGKINEKTVQWAPEKTAIIICDMWDDHWCKSASRRVAEMAGPLNEAVKAARSRGVFIIHAPSSVTAFYEGTPQRRRARDEQARHQGHAGQEIEAD